MADKHPPIAYEGTRRRGRPSFPWEQAAADEFVVEWQIRRESCDRGEQPHVQNKPMPTEFFVEWQMVEANCDEADRSQLHTRPSQ